MFLHKEPVKGKMGIAELGDTKFTVSKVIERAKCQISRSVGEQEGPGKREAALGRDACDEEREQQSTARKFDFLDD